MLIMRLIILFCIAIFLLFFYFWVGWISVRKDPRRGSWGIGVVDRVQHCMDNRRTACSNRGHTKWNWHFFPFFVHIKTRKKHFIRLLQKKVTKYEKRGDISRAAVIWWDSLGWCNQGTSPIPKVNYSNVSWHYPSELRIRLFLMTVNNLIRNTQSSSSSQKSPNRIKSQQPKIWYCSNSSKYDLKTEIQTSQFFNN